MGKTIELGDGISVQYHRKVSRSSMSHVDIYRGPNRGSLMARVYLEPLKFDAPVRGVQGTLVSKVVSDYTLMLTLTRPFSMAEICVAFASVLNLAPSSVTAVGVCEGNQPPLIVLSGNIDAKEWKKALDQIEFVGDQEV